MFPSVTMPNHESIVTGRYPDRHGIINNDMEDPAIGSFDNSRDDPRWYASATPIWITAEQAGLKTESMLWPAPHGKAPAVSLDHWSAYDTKLSGDARVDQVLKWMDRPPSARPDLILLYFDIVDSNGHRFGPDSAEVNQATASVDASIGRLTAGLALRHLSADLIIVSDHGMAPVYADTLITVDDTVDLRGGHMVARGVVGGFNLPSGRDRALVLHDLTAPHPHYACWEKGKVPAK